jgi:hypothetical protein
MSTPSRGTITVTLELDPEEMARRGRIGAHVLHSRHDSSEIAARAREGLARKYLDEVDPDRTLPEAERLRRAEHARRAHLARAARLSVLARSTRKAVAHAVA